MTHNASSSIGLFFSLGVDSFYSLLRNLNKSEEPSETINHLIVIEGFDIRAKKGNLHLYQDVLNNSSKVARQFDLHVMPVSTNIRELTSDIVLLSWHDYFGAALASIGLHLEDYFSRFYIASGLNPVYLPSGDTHGEFLPEVSPDEVAGEPIPKTSTPIVGTGPRGEVALGALCSQIATSGKLTGNAYIHSNPK